MPNPLPSESPTTRRVREWRSSLATLVSGLLIFETISGLAIWLLPFSVPSQWLVLVHTVAGLLFLAPFVVYQAQHWWKYRNRPWSHYLVTGYVALAIVLVNVASGVILTWQGLFSARISYAWSTVHLVTTFGIVTFFVAHVALIILRDRKSRSAESRAVVGAERRWAGGVLALTLLGFAALVVSTAMYEPVVWHNEFPPDYSQGDAETPFRPSLATTASGGAYDDRSLTGSEGCGTTGCHEQIYEEWSISAHRWSSMDPAFQAIQEVMAEQNGPESTRYCGGCHDPASLFAGTKNVFAEDLTSVLGYDEGISCLVCHSIRETDLQGNANYVIEQPDRYVFETKEGPTAKLLSDFLIRTYPEKHIETFSKRLFKTPEYCAACHKQFIDQEVNQVGWVQLQNQYDNWRKSKWNPPDDPDRIVECRECHMPLQDSMDPAAGDDLDSYRHGGDGKHRDHRFVAANSFIPMLLELEGWEEQHRLTEEWLRGEREIPEIAHKWESGPAVEVKIQCPDVVTAGEPVDVRVLISSNKVGHDFPTGPLDIIQSWISLEVRDDAGEIVYSTGSLDEDRFIEPGAFMFKAEPVDRYGNLIDRHNLWEMVGVRFRRALFPGFSDAASFTFSCPSEIPAPAEPVTAGSPPSPERKFTITRTSESRTLHLTAHLDYRKVDQYLLNYMFGKDSGVTAPVIRMATDEKTVRIEGV